MLKNEVFKNSGFLLLGLEDVSSCAARHVFLCHKKTCLLVSQEDMSSDDTRRHAFFCHKKTSCLVSQEDMSSCATRKKPISTKYHFYAMSFGTYLDRKHTICVPCVWGPLELTFLPLWGFEAVGGQR